MLSGVARIHQAQSLRQIVPEYALVQVGSLMYVVTGARPGICFAVGVFEQVAHDPGERHLTATRQVFRYLLIYLIQATNQAVTPKGYVAKQTRIKENTASCRPSAEQLQQKGSVDLHGALCANLGVQEYPLTNKRKK